MITSHIQPLTASFAFIVIIIIIIVITTGETVAVEFL